MNFAFYELFIWCFYSKFAQESKRRENRHVTDQLTKLKLLCFKNSFHTILNNQ